jgi:hypothetical protein
MKRINSWARFAAIGVLWIGWGLAMGATRELLTGMTVSTVITRSDPGALVVSLVSPGGVTFTLSSRNGGLHPNVFAGTIWNDTAGPGRAVSRFTYADNAVASPLLPEEALSELNGTNPSGNWNLIVRAVGGGTGGSLGPVSLAAHTAHCLPDLEAGVVPDAFIPRLGVINRVVFRSENRGDRASGVVLTGTLPPASSFRVSRLLAGTAALRRPPARFRRCLTMRRATARRDRAIILVLPDTGLRSSELCALDIGDVEIKTGKIIVRHGPEDGSKAGRGRTVYLGNTTRHSLWRYLVTRDDRNTESSPLFAAGHHGLNRDSLRHLVALTPEIRADERCSQHRVGAEPA